MHAHTYTQTESSLKWSDFKNPARVFYRLWIIKVTTSVVLFLLIELAPPLSLLDSSVVLESCLSCWIFQCFFCVLFFITKLAHSICPNLSMLETENIKYCNMKGLHMRHLVVSFLRTRPTFGHESAIQKKRKNGDKKDLCEGSVWIWVPPAVRLQTVRLCCSEFFCLCFFVDLAQHGNPPIFFILFFSVEIPPFFSFFFLKISSS